MKPEEISGISLQLSGFEGGKYICISCSTFYVGQILLVFHSCCGQYIHLTQNQICLSPLITVAVCPPLITFHPPAHSWMPAGQKQECEWGAPRVPRANRSTSVHPPSLATSLYCYITVCSFRSVPAVFGSS